MLNAKGSGTTIVTDPSFAPVWDVGPQFSKSVYRQTFKFMNNGRRMQQVYWMTEGFPLTKSRKKHDYNADDMKFKVFELLIYYMLISISYFCSKLLLVYRKILNINTELRHLSTF